MRASIARLDRAADSLGAHIESLVQQSAAVDPESIADAAINFGLVLAREKIAAGLRRHGIDLKHDQPLTVDTLKELLSDRIGVAVDSITPEGIAEALNKVMSAEISRRLEVDIDLLHGGDIVEQCKAAAIQAVQSGKPSKLVSGYMLARLKRARALAMVGVVGPEDQQTVMNRLRQRRWRKASKQTWVDDV